MSQAGCDNVYIQQCKAHWSEVYQDDDSSLVVSDILLWAQVGLVSSLGSFLLFAILHFERFGGDVQKRALVIDWYPMGQPIPGCKPSRDPCSSLQLGMI